jgi:putative ABC transport system substrate-binding protein
MMALPVVADAQASRTAKVWRIGFLRVGTLPINDVFWESMRERSWVLNQNVTVEPRYADKPEQLPALAAELVQLNVDLIITNGTPATLAAQHATKTIPIVFYLALDPARRGVVASMARPGGNATGFAYGSYTHKLLEVLKEALPRVSRVAYPVLAGEVPEAQSNPEFSRAAAALGLQLQGVKIDSAADFEGFYAAVRRAGAEAVLIQDSPSFVPRIHEIGAGATNSRLPAIGFAREFAQGGGLLYYGPASAQHWPRLAAQIDKIFNGAKPGDLPVEQPTTFGLAVNMKAAKALGVTIPQAVLIRANDRIQ